MAVYALFEGINALAIEIDLVRIRTMMRCCRKFKTLWLQVAHCYLSQASKIRGERESTMNTNTINSKNVISGVNDLATKCPKISAMWSDKNDYTPSEISARSERRAIFVCPVVRKSSWQAFALWRGLLHPVLPAVPTAKCGCALSVRHARTSTILRNLSAPRWRWKMAAKPPVLLTMVSTTSLTVEFEDGFVLYHARWNQFVRGALHHNQKNINE